MIIALLQTEDLTLNKDNLSSFQNIYLYLFFEQEILKNEIKYINNDISEVQIDELNLKAHKRLEDSFSKLITALDNSRDSLNIHLKKIKDSLIYYDSLMLGHKRTLEQILVK